MWDLLWVAIAATVLFSAVIVGAAISINSEGGDDAHENDLF